jgi:hypothetical protein
MTSLTEIMEQRLKEREILNDNIEYTTVFNNGQPDNALPIVNTNGNYTNNNTYSNMDEYLNDNNVKKPTKSNIDNIPRYFLKSGDNQIEIKDTGCLECNPPIITFDNNFDLQLPNTVDIIMFKVVINNKEFEYPFVYKNEFISKTNFDERFEGMDIPNSLRTETRFCKWTILNGQVKNMPTDDNYRYLTFAIQGDKLLFRQANFRMIDDGLYKEQYGYPETAKKNKIKSDLMYLNGKI